MKILFVTSYFYPVIGGAETYMYNIAKELINKGHTVEILVSNSSRDGKKIENESSIDGIKVRRFKTIFRFGFSGVFFPGLFRAVKTSDADIVHVHGYRHPFNYVFLFTNKPCFMTPHWPDYPKGSRSKWLENLIPVYDKLLGPYVFSKFKKIFADTGAEIPWLINNFNISKEKIIISPCCIPNTYLKKYNENKFRKKHNIKKEDILVLSVARIHKTKGQDQIIKVANYFPKAKFVFVGIDGGYLNELKKLTLELKLKNIIFTGEVSEEEKMEAYSAADIFCHPSHYEAFGIVVLEAFSQNTAVITSNSGGLPWVVNNAGLIFEDNNLEDLKNKLTLLIKNKSLRKELANKGTKRVKEFSWKKTAEIIEEEYKKSLR